MREPRPAARGAKSVASNAARLAARLAAALAVAVALAALAACGGRTASRAEHGPAGGPVAVVTRFLEAAAREDHATMAALFGTASGPLGEQGGAGCAVRRMGSWLRLARACPSPGDVERRMALLAALLDHAAFRVVRDGQTAGEGHAGASAAVVVSLELAAGGTAVVPFVVVQNRRGAWLVREVGLRALAGG